MDKALLQRVLDALATAVKQNQHDMLMTGSECRAGEAAIAAIQSAIAQPEQPALQPLTDDQITAIFKSKEFGGVYRQCNSYEFARAIEAAHNIKAQPTPAGMCLTDIDALAKVYASSYASPHHITFTVDGLRAMIAAHKAEKD